MDKGNALGPDYSMFLGVDDGRVVKGIRFKELRDAGDPVQVAQAYETQGADELVFLDITASSDDRKTMRDLVEETASTCFMPVTVGGGIRNLDNIREMLLCGADKGKHKYGSHSQPRIIGPSIYSIWKSVYCCCD